jgi:hypothetical protein
MRETVRIKKNSPQLLSSRTHLFGLRHMPFLLFEFETSKAQLMSTQERILDAVDRYGVKRASDELLPEVEMLGKATGPYFKYRLRVPLEGTCSEAQISAVSASVPVGVRLRLEGA